MGKYLNVLSLISVHLKFSFEVCVQHNTYKFIKGLECLINIGLKIVFVSYGNIMWTQIWFAFTLLLYYLPERRWTQ